MYGSDYWKRAGLQQICEYLVYGSEGKEPEQGTPEERQFRYGKALGQSIRSFRDKIIQFDWDSISNDERKKQMETDEMFEDVIKIINNLNQLAYEMGFITGLKIQKDIFQMKVIPPVSADG